MLQRAVEPAYADYIQEHIYTHNRIQGLFFLKLRHCKKQQQEHGVGDHRSHRIDQQELLHSFRKLTIILPDLCARPDPVGRNAKGSDHRQIRDHGSCGGNLPVSLDKKHPRHIRKRNHRKNDRRNRIDKIHDHIELNGTDFHDFRRTFPLAQRIGR